MNDEESSMPFLSGMGAGKNPYAMGEGKGSENAQDRATKMALSAAKKYGPPQVKLAANALSNPKVMAVMKRMRYLRFLGCFGVGGCLPILLIIMLAGGVVGIAYGLLTEGGWLSWLGEAYSWFNNEFSEIMDAIEIEGE